MAWLPHLDPEAKYWHRLWSTRAALTDAVVSGLWMALPAFQRFVPPFHFAALSIAMALAVFVARILDQPSIPRTGDPNA